MRARYTTFAQLVEITEELFDSDALHDNDGLETVLNVRGVVRDVNVVLHEAVVDHVQALSGLLEEGRNLLGAHTDLFELLGLGALRLVLREHVFGTVNILAEVEIVDLLSVAAVAVATSDEVEQLLTWRHDVESLHDAKELLSSDVLRL